MAPDDASQVTRILHRAGAGDRAAVDELLPLVYDQLRRDAQNRMAGERADHTLGATALVHEAYLRLVGDRRLPWLNRAHFYAAAAEAMRRILVERARRRGRIKHGGGRQRIPLDDVAAEADEKILDFMVLDEALCRMEKQDERMSRVVMLRFFAGLTIEDTAQALGISPMTVKREWACARAWLYDELFADEE